LVPDDDDNVAANSATSNEENGVNLASPVAITSGTGVPVVQKSDANVGTTSDRIDVLSNVSVAPPTDAEAVPEVHAVNDATFSSTLMEDGMTAKVFYGKRRPTASERTSKRLRRIPKRLQ
jgi:hypothetical protein